MQNMLYVLRLHANLLSVSKLISKGLKVYFKSFECIMRASNGEILIVATLESSLYQLDTNVMNGAYLTYLGYSNAHAFSKILAQEIGES